MFFQADRIRDNLTCINCKNVLVEPKTLPCGETVCEDCLDQAITDSVACEFKCCICASLHPIPPNGFPTNKLIARLIAQKPDEIYRGKIAKSLKQSLDYILQSHLELSKSLENSRFKIKNHCNRVRDEIEAALEKITESLAAQKTSLFNEVDLYEKNCLKNLAHSEHFKEELIKFLNKVFDFDQFWRDYLKNLDFNEEEISLALKTARNFQSRLKMEKVRLESLTFNRKLLKFDQSSSDFSEKNNLKIGSLFYIRDDFPDFSQWSKIELKHKLFTYAKCVGEMCSMKMEEFFSGNLFISYICNSANKFGVSKLKLVILDSNGNYLRSSKEETYSDEYKIYKCNELILVCLRSNIGYSNLKVFNEDLHRVHFVDFLTFVASPVQALCANNTNIYLAYIQDGKTLIYCIDWNMEPVLVGKESSLKLPIHFRHEISQMDCFDELIYLRHRVGDEVTVLDQRSGEFLTTFKVSGKKFYVDTNGLIVSYCARTHKLTHCNSDGEVLYENEFVGFPQDLQFYLNSRNGNVLFFNPVEFVLYKINNGNNKFFSSVDWYLNVEVLDD